MLAQVVLDFIIGIYSAIRTTYYPVEMSYYPDNLVKDLQEVIKDNYTVSCHDNFFIYYKLIDFVWVEINFKTFETEIKEKFFEKEEAWNKKYPEYSKEFAQRKETINNTFPELIKLIFEPKIYYQLK